MLGRRDPLASPERLVRRVYSYVAYRIGDGPDAEDVTSETFARALRYRASYDPSRGEPAAWLLGIARRCVDDLLSRRPDVTGDPPDRADDGRFEERAVERISLAGALAALGARDRELIALRYGADLTARQIGELTETTTNAVEVALHRALDRLRSLLDRPAAPEPAAPRVRVRPPAPVSVVERTSEPTGEAA